MPAMQTNRRNYPPPSRGLPVYSTNLGASSRLGAKSMTETPGMEAFRHGWTMVDCHSFDRWKARKSDADDDYVCKLGDLKGEECVNFSVGGSSRCKPCWLKLRVRRTPGASWCEAARAAYFWRIGLCFFLLPPRRSCKLSFFINEINTISWYSF